MIIKNNHPGTKENPPKFIMVKFDGMGNPVGAKPINNPSVCYGEDDKNSGHVYEFDEKTEPSNLVLNNDIIKKLIFFVVKNTESLRQEIKESNYYSQQILRDIRDNNQSQLNDSLLDQTQILKQEIENFGNWANLQIEYNQAIEKKLEEMNLNISNLTKEITGTKNHEMDYKKALKPILENLLILIQEVKNQKLVKSTLEEKLNELSKNQKQMKEDLLVTQENLSKKVENDILLKIQKMMKKTKKRPSKPQKAKVIMFLKNDFQIGLFSKVLVVTDKRNSVFGKILHESVRKLTENAIYVAIENRKKEETLDIPVLEAIKQSDYVFMIGKHPKAEMKEIAEMLRNIVKIVLIKRSLKYSIL